jgi:apolipoprotein D and lipocalin family protein
LSSPGNLSYPDKIQTKTAADPLFRYMKREKWILPAVAGATVAAGVAYALWPKREIPKGADVVTPFDMDKYVGLWNEIARLPNPVEKNFTQLAERYIANGDGTYHVVTRAYNSKKEKWIEATGKLKVAEPGTGHLKVSYFGPFYLNYNILDIDENYEHALASGSDNKTMWLLSKETSMPEDIQVRFLQKASDYGFDVSKLIWNNI